MDYIPERLSIPILISIFLIYQIFKTSCIRLFHTGKICFATEKSQLAALRKKTGYTFSNCKKALELHNDDIGQAEVWLKQQAQTLGWSKATKLEGRQTTQGLIGVAVKNKDGVLIEMNCETDFVARNQEFQTVIEEAANTCLTFTKNQQTSSDGVTKVIILLNDVSKKILCLYNFFCVLLTSFTVQDYSLYFCTLCFYYCTFLNTKNLLTFKSTYILKIFLLIFNVFSNTIIFSPKEE